jgi:hypothetical protein
VVLPVIRALVVLTAAAAVGTAVVAAGDDPPLRPKAAQSDSRVTLGDPAHAVSGALPAGWDVQGHATALSFPVELFTAGSYRVATGGSCGPQQALDDLPSDGALIFAFEYRPAVGHVSSRGFPARPAHIRLRRRDVSPAECIGRPGWLVRFRDHGRPIQIHVVLGRRATQARRIQVERFLDSLRFAPLPAPPPDPYAGWHSAVDEAGDSFRSPPGWAAAVTAVPRLVARPRTLFMTADGPLPGLPASARHVAKRHSLPRPAPTHGHTALWIVERPPGEASAAYPPFPKGRPWPQPADLSPAGPGRLRARAGCHGVRFEALIAGPRQAPALKAAQAAAFSCGIRERQLALSRQPYLAVRCPIANSFACDRAGLAVWLRSRVTRLSATIGGRTFPLHRNPGRYWEGSLLHAGFTDPASPLHITPDRPPDHWEGRHPVSVIVRIEGRLPDGQLAARRLRLPLRAGWG